MELRILLLADYANIDGLSGKLNILGVFDKIYAENFPAIHHALHVVIKLSVELGEYGDRRKLIVKFLDEDGVDVIILPLDFSTPTKGSNPEVNAILEIRDLVFQKPGRYEVVVMVDRDQKGSIPLDVVYKNNLKESN